MSAYKELAKKYPEIVAYEVRPGVLMTAKFSEDGQACEMYLEKQHHTPNKIELSSIIPSELAEQIIDELVPKETRGQPTKKYFKGESESTIGGGVMETESDYENVTITRIRSVSDSSSIAGDEVIIIQWKKRNHK